MTHDVIDEALQIELDHNLFGLGILQCGIAYHGVDSTNEEALVLEKLGAQSGTVVIAAVQTEGRGRHKRKWMTHEGDVAMSIILRPPHLPKNWALISLMPALAAAQGLSHLGVDVRLKWPNDIIVKKKDAEERVLYFDDFRKLGGILVENVFLDSSLAACVIGMGLNCTSIEDRKALVPHIATLFDYHGISRKDVVRAILTQFDQMLLSVTNPGFAANLIAAYSERCETLLRNVGVETPMGPLEARALRLTHEGALVVHDGVREHIICAGDVIFTR